MKSNYLGLLDNKYIIKKIIGAGTSSTVYQVIDSQSGKEYAAKVFKHFDNSIKKEIEFNEIIANMNNNLFIKYIASSKGPLVQNEYRFFKSYIIFELASKGGLHKYLGKKYSGLKEKYCKFIFFKILKGIQSLHNSGICHRDIKINNILLDGEKYNIKISDFGLSSFISRNQSQQYGKVGTKYYAAPEVIMNLPYDGIKADIFSLGVVLFNLRTSNFGFYEAKIKNNNFVNYVKCRNKTLYEYIKDKNICTYWEKLGSMISIDELSHEFKNLYIKMVSFNPSERPTIEEILNDDWMKEIQNLSEQQMESLKKEIINELKKREETEKNEEMNHD